MSVTNTSKAIMGLTQEIREQNASTKNNELQNEENRREMIELLSEIRDNLAGGGVSTPDLAPLDEKKGFGLNLSKFLKVPIAQVLGVLVASIAFIPGLVIGFFEGLGSVLKKLFPKTTKKITDLFTRIKTFFTNIIARFKDIGKLVKGRASGIVKSVKNFFQPISNFFKALKGRVLNNPVIKNISKFAKNLGRDFSKLGKTLKALRGGGGAGPGTGLITRIIKPFKTFGSVIQRFFSPFQKFLGTAGKFAPKFFKAGKILGRIGGKLFLPLTIIMGIVDGIKGFINTTSDASTSAGAFVDKLGGAVTGIINGIIGMPLDLLKDGVAWLMGKFGFTEEADALKEFSFQDQISNIIGTMFDFVQKAVDGIVEFFQDPVGNIKTAFASMKNMGEEFLKKILRAILPPAELFKFKTPDVNILGKQFGGTEVNLNPIPASLYDFANTPAPTQNDSGAKMSAAQTGVENAQDEVQAATQQRAIPVVVRETPASTNGAPSSVVMNNVSGERNSAISKQVQAEEAMAF